MIRILVEWVKDWWLLFAFVLTVIGIIGGGVAWLFIAEGRAHSRFVEPCAASGKHDRWECEALWGQSQGVSGVPVVVGR